MLTLAKSLAFFTAIPAANDNHYLRLVRDNATTFRIGATTKNPTYNAFNQVNKWDATHTYVHDNNGNLLSGDGSKTYKYDAENRLIEVNYVGGSNKSVFSYDGLNRRTVVAETVSGVTTAKRYLWCGDRICQVRDASDTVLKRILPEGEFTVAGSVKQIYMQDQLGSVRDVLDATTGTRVKSYDYTAYGKVARNNGTGDTDYRYAGLWAHTQSGLNLAKYRAQDPATGRWINRDPIREAGGLNLYGYAGTNPANFYDPDGKLSIPFPAGAAACPWCVAGGVAAVLVYKGCKWVYDYVSLNEESTPPTPEAPKPADPTRGEGKNNQPKSDLPRKPNGDYAPHPDAEGAHTTTGTREGSNGENYTQGATFDENGNFTGRTDVTNHGRSDHTNPHYHPATGSNSTGPAMPIP